MLMSFSDMARRDIVHHSGSVPTRDDGVKLYEKNHYIAMPVTQEFHCN